MKIISLATKRVYDVDVGSREQTYTQCPECSHDRKHKKAKSFSFNRSAGVGMCHNCNASFVIYKPMPEKKEYKIPQWKNRTKLSDGALNWFASRMISVDTLNRMNISSATEWMPQVEKNQSVVCFPYYRDGQLVNIKYRDGAKNFKMEQGAEQILYNIDSIGDEKQCVIVEGEIDCLSFMEAGVKNVVSVPNGAGGTSMEYIDNCFDKLQQIEKFYIAVDQDNAGHKLQQELIRRFGAERCAVVRFDDCKDANEFLVKHGGLDLRETITTAVDVPVKGIITQVDIYDKIYHLYTNGLQPGKSLMIGKLDDLITWETGRLLIVTGIPGHGKSEVVDFIAARLNAIHGWKVAYYSPENYPLELHHSKIASKISGKEFSSSSLAQAEFEQVFEYVNDNYYFIYPEEDITIENILEKARYTVRKYGVRVLVVDPYNKLEHLKNQGESETEYVSRFLDKLSMFAKVNDCLVVLVAHPTKMQRQKDNRSLYEIPTLYDISGSANFYNKADYGMVVYRDFVNHYVDVIVAKVKFKHLGRPGSVQFSYNYHNGRIYEISDGNDSDTYIGRQWEKLPEVVLPLEDEAVPF